MEDKRPSYKQSSAKISNIVSHPQSSIQSLQNEHSLLDLSISSQRPTQIIAENQKQFKKPSTDQVEKLSNTSTTKQKTIKKINLIPAATPQHIAIHATVSNYKIKEESLSVCEMVLEESIISVVLKNIQNNLIQAKINSFISQRFMIDCDQVIQTKYFRHTQKKSLVQIAVKNSEPQSPNLTIPPSDRHDLVLKIKNVKNQKQISRLSHNKSLKVLTNRAEQKLSSFFKIKTNIQNKKSLQTPIAQNPSPPASPLSSEISRLRTEKSRKKLKHFELYGFLGHEIPKQQQRHILPMKSGVTTTNNGKILKIQQPAIQLPDIGLPVFKVDAEISSVRKKRETIVRQDIKLRKQSKEIEQKFTDLRLSSHREILPTTDFNNIGIPENLPISYGQSSHKLNPGVILTTHKPESLIPTEENFIPHRFIDDQTPPKLKIKITETIPQDQKALSNNKSYNIKADESHRVTPKEPLRLPILFEQEIHTYSGKCSPLPTRTLQKSQSHFALQSKQKHGFYARM